MKISQPAGGEHEAAWSRISKEMAMTMSENTEPGRKPSGRDRGSPRSTRSSRADDSERATPLFKSSPGQPSTVTRSRSAAKTTTQGRANSSRSQPRTPVQAKNFSPLRPTRSASPTRDRSPTGARSQSSSGQALSSTALASQNALLERELRESQEARAQLEQKLDEERSRAAADRAQLSRLAARMEQLENSREVNTGLLEDNRFLRAELEAEKLMVQELSHKLELARGSGSSSTAVLTSSHEKLLEENEKLRNDLKQSQVMLAKYTEELTMIMPDVEMILNQWKTEKGANSGSPSSSTAPTLLAMLDPTSSSNGHPQANGHAEDCLERPSSGQPLSPMQSRPQRPASPVGSRNQQRLTSPSGRASASSAKARPRSAGRGSGLGTRSSGISSFSSLANTSSRTNLARAGRPR